MTLSITIYTDYVCPYCLLAEQVIEETIQGLDIDIRWRPFELRPDPVPTLRVEDPYLPKVWNQSVYPMAERLGVPIKLPSISPQPRTDKAFEVFAMADTQGLGHAFSMRALKAFFQEEKDLGDQEVLADLGSDAGLDRDAVLNALKEGTYRAQHQQALRHACEEMAITSVPTIVIGHRIIRGVPTQQELEQALGSVSQVREETGNAHDSGDNIDTHYH